MGLKEDFLRIYSNLPLSIRTEIIAVIDKEPMTWNAVYIEVYNNTRKAPIILKKLRDLGVI